MLRFLRRGTLGTFRRGSRPIRPSLESLEGRQLLYSATGARWSSGARITYSFMPDGTSLGGNANVLNQRMGALGISTAAWQLQFREAAAVWEAVANVQLTQVGDDGSPLGVAGNQQGDPRFGDIRIGGYSLANAGQLAFTFAPPPANGGTLAGDLLLNTDQPWRVDSGAFDLQTVAIHELGHALGLGHSALAAADMYAYYNGTKSTLTADDVAGVRSIYGPIPADPLNNNSFANAINLAPIANAYGQISLGGQSIKDPNTDVDYFKATAPPTTNGTLIVVVQAGQLSSLSPRVLVYDQLQRLVGQVSQPLSYGGNAVLAIPNVVAGQVYTIRCQAAGSDPSGFGAYGLLVNFGGPAMSSVAPPITAVSQQADQGGGVFSQDVSTQPSWLARLQEGLAATKSFVLGEDGANPVPELLELLKKITIGTVTGVGDSLLTMASGGHAHDDRPRNPSAPAGHDAGSSHAVRDAIAPLEGRSPGADGHGPERKAAGGHRAPRPQIRRPLEGLRPR